MEDEIHYRKTLGNEAYYANTFLFKSRLVSKKSELKQYWRTIKPRVTCGYEVPVLGGTIKNTTAVS